MAHEHLLKILEIKQVAPNVKRFRLQKPQDFIFIPGHSAMIALPHEKHNSHPFSFTSTNEDPFLEFHIKQYPNKDNFTQKLHALKVGDSLVLADIFGSIRYTLPGLMIAGGQAITPFIAILRHLSKDNALTGNALIHSVQTTKDLFLQDELKSILKEKYIVTLTRECTAGYLHGRITPELLKRYLPANKRAYILGPDAFVSQIRSQLKQL